MAGNTRGKLKEHYEGLHRNFDWCLKHINPCLELIAVQLMATDPDKYKLDDAEKSEAALMTYPLYEATKSLGEAIQTLDEVAKNVYNTL